MSYAFLTASIIDGVALAILYILVRSRYEQALTSVEEKSAGRLYHFRNSISRLLRGKFNPDGLYCFLLYVCLHLIVPFLGLGLFLKTDANFLVVVVSLFWSAQLIQRLFPGGGDETEESE